VGINEGESVTLTDGEKDGITNDIDDGITDGKVEELLDSDCTSVDTGVCNFLLGCDDDGIVDAFFFVIERGIPFRFDKLLYIICDEVILVVLFVGKGTWWAIRLEELLDSVCSRAGTGVYNVLFNDEIIVVFSVDRGGGLSFRLVEILDSSSLYSNGCNDEGTIVGFVFGKDRG